MSIIGNFFPPPTSPALNGYNSFVQHCNKGDILGDPSSSNIIPSGGGFFGNLTVQIKLVLRLMADRRINPLLKLLPIGSLIYLIAPDIAFGPIDDAFVIWLGTALFVELCPQEIVREHRDSLTSVIEGEWREIDGSDEAEPDHSSQP